MAGAKGKFKARNKNKEELMFTKYGGMALAVGAAIAFTLLARAALVELAVTEQGVIMLIATGLASVGGVVMNLRSDGS